MADAGKREVNRLMTRSFRPGTRVFGATKDVLLQSPQIASRRPLVRQSLSAYKRRDWYLVINGLLPLVEGVLVDFAYQSAPAPRRGRPKKALRELREKENASLGVAVDTLKTMLNLCGSKRRAFRGLRSGGLRGFRRAPLSQ